MIHMASRVAVVVAISVAVFAQPLSAQKVMLQIKPHVGDTIKMHLTQTVEMSGTRWNASSDSTKKLTTSTEVFSRAVPFQWTSGGTLIHAITDSVTTGAIAVKGSASSARRVPTPAAAVLRVASDGAIEVVDNGDAASEIRHIFAEMPSMLPRKPVAVGEKWKKEMRIPLAGDPGSEGTVKATLQFDSLSKNEQLAFISIHGTISRFLDGDRRASASTYHTSGTFTGSMQIDRALGWITDAKSVISVHSEIAEERSARERPAKPLLIQTKISVWTRAVKQE
jgi:hypothetical protein